MGRPWKQGGVEAALAIEARLEGLRHALLLAANLPHSPILTAASAAGHLNELIWAIKRSPAVRRDDAGGAEFLDRLGRDPEARL